MKDELENLSDAVRRLDPDKAEDYDYLRRRIDALDATVPGDAELTLADRYAAERRRQWIASQGSVGATPGTAEAGGAKMRPRTPTTTG